jgi:hypothetical protein
MAEEAPAPTPTKASVTKRHLAETLASVALFGTTLPAALMAVLALWWPADWLVVGGLGLCLLGWLAMPPLLLASALAGVERKLPGHGARVDDEQLFLGAPEQAIPRQEIVGGICVRGLATPTVELSLRRGGSLRITMPSEADALALLRDLDLEGNGRKVAHELATTKPVIRVGGTLLIAALFSGLFGLGLAFVQTMLRIHSSEGLFSATSIAFFAVAWLATFRRAPPQIVVGSDGVMLTGTPERFIPYSRIAAITNDLDGVYLVTMGRTFGQRLRLSPQLGPRSDALVEELRTALKRAEGAAEGGRPARLEQLDRRERSLPQWRDELKRLGMSEADYRNAGIERDHLVDVASDVHASKARRVAAALALSHTQDEAAIERVRIAVDGLADQEMRSFLTEALEGSLEDAALDELVSISEISQKPAAR